MISPKLLLLAGIAVAIAVSVGGAYLKGRFDGRDLERVAWQARELEEVTRANAAIAFLNEAYRKLEARSVAATTAASTKYQKELRNVRVKKDRVIADLRSGALRLRVPVTSCQDSDRGRTPPPGAPTGGRDAAPRAELSETAARFLTELAAEADEVVLQLQACQAIVRADRGTGEED